MVRDMARNFAETELYPVAGHIDQVRRAPCPSRVACARVRARAMYATRVRARAMCPYMGRGGGGGGGARELHRRTNTRPSRLRSSPTSACWA